MNGGGLVHVTAEVPAQLADDEFFQIFLCILWHGLVVSYSDRLDAERPPDRTASMDGLPVCGPSVSQGHAGCHPSDRTPQPSGLSGSACPAAGFFAADFRATGFFPAAFSALAADLRAAGLRAAGFFAADFWGAGSPVV